MSFGALNEELEVLGISIEAGVSPETIFVSMSALAKHADRALELFADILRRPAFDTTRWRPTGVVWWKTCVAWPRTPSVS